MSSSGTPLDLGSVSAGQFSLSSPTATVHSAERHPSPLGGGDDVPSPSRLSFPSTQGGSRCFPKDPGHGTVRGSFVSPYRDPGSAKHEEGVDRGGEGPPNSTCDASVRARRRIERGDHAKPRRAKPRGGTRSRVRLCCARTGCPPRASSSVFPAPPCRRSRPAFCSLLPFLPPLRPGNTRRASERVHNRKRPGGGPHGAANASRLRGASPPPLQVGILIHRWCMGPLEAPDAPSLGVTGTRVAQ